MCNSTIQIEQAKDHYPKHHLLSFEILNSRYTLPSLAYCPLQSFYSTDP